MLIVYIFYLLVYTGKDPSNPDQTFLEIIEASDSFSALLWGTMVRVSFFLSFLQL